MFREQNPAESTINEDIETKEQTNSQSPTPKHSLQMHYIIEVFSKIQTESQLFSRNLKLFNMILSKVLQDKSLGEKTIKLIQMYLQLQKDSAIYAKFIDNFRDKYGIDIENKQKEFHNACLIRHQLSISALNQQIFYQECILLLSVSANNLKFFCQLMSKPSKQSTNDSPKDFEWSKVTNTFNRLKNTILVLSNCFFFLEEEYFSQKRTLLRNSITHTLYLTRQNFDNIQKKYHKMAGLTIKHKVVSHRGQKSQGKEDGPKSKEGKIINFFKRNFPSFYHIFYSSQKCQEDQDEKQPLNIKDNDF